MLIKNGSFCRNGRDMEYWDDLERSENEGVGLGSYFKKESQTNMKQALIIVDVQNDFCPGGALAVSGADVTFPYINSYIKHSGRCYQGG